MEDLSVLLTDWAKAGSPGLDEAAAFSIVAPAKAMRAKTNERLAPSFMAAGAELTPAFSDAELRAETEDRFWILTFNNLTARGTEDLAFRAARALKAELKADSVRPILIDSIVGGAYATDDPAIMSGICSTDDDGPAQKGWAPSRVGALIAWRKTRGEGVTIASIDTGYTDHDELKDVIVMKGQRNFIEKNKPDDARDPLTSGVLLHPGHGTLVASVVASRGTLKEDFNTDGGVTGMAPDAKVLPIRATTSVITWRQKHIPGAINHAVAKNCQVIVFALGSLLPIESVEVALRDAVRKGVVIVSAAGNCIGVVAFPARFSKQGLTAAIAAVDSQFAPWERTSKGESVTISAFGEAVWGARKDPDHPSDNKLIRPQEGTTLAASLTAGAAALWIAAKQGSTELRAKAERGGVTVQALFNEALRATAHKPSGWPSSGMGAGVLNAGELVGRSISALRQNLLPLDKPHVSYVTPLRKLLADAVGEMDSTAALEAESLDEDVAAEALWRFGRARAVKRAQAMRMATAAGPTITTDLAAALTDRPHLTALL